MNKNEVYQQLARELQLGDHREKIEFVLTREGINFTFDKYRNRYQATIRNKNNSTYSATSVYIYIDVVGKMSKLEVSDSFTMP